MAVPGADRRKPTDKIRTDGVDSTTPGRSESGGSPTASGSDGSDRSVGVSVANGGPFADNTGNREVQVLNGIAETDDRLATAPPAIEVVTGPTVVAEQSGGTPVWSTGSDGNFGENSIYLHCLDPDPDACRRAAVVDSPNQPCPDGAASVAGPRKTVITK